LNAVVNESPIAAMELGHVAARAVAARLTKAVAAIVNAAKTSLRRKRRKPSGERPTPVG
jgi:predicted membrane GTPase involved in stress response